MYGFQVQGERENLVAASVAFPTLLPGLNCYHAALSHPVLLPSCPGTPLYYSVAYSLQRAHSSFLSSAEAQSRAGLSPLTQFVP